MHAQIQAVILSLQSVGGGLQLILAVFGYTLTSASVCRGRAVDEQKRVLHTISFESHISYCTSITESVILGQLYVCIYTHPGKFPHSTLL